MLLISDWQIDWCTDVMSGHAHLSYSLDSSGSVVDPGSSDPCLAFKLFSIPNSNLYVIIYRPTSACQTPQVIWGNGLHSGRCNAVPLLGCLKCQFILLAVVKARGGGYIERKVMEINLYCKKFFHVYISTMYNHVFAS